MNLMTAYFSMRIITDILNLTLEEFLDSRPTIELPILWRGSELLLDLTGCIDSTL